jgi:class 3 adenylate cyclase
MWSRAHRLEGDCQRAKDWASDEQQTIDKILSDLYPASILRRLRDGEQPILDQYARTSVLFTDIVGFTQWSSQLHPYTLASKLNIIYSIFDHLAETFGVYKVETIGDAYMAVAGCPVRREDHAVIIARFAMALLGAAEQLRSLISHASFQIRAGIHSGALVAGVVGNHRPHFHLFGDTVNTASRMESNGIPGRVQVSTATRELLQSCMECELRGEFKIKGRGQQELHIVRLPDLISHFQWDVRLISASEMSYMAVEILIRGGALDLLDCSLSELDALVSTILSGYGEESHGGRVVAVSTLHAVHNLYTYTRLYDEMDVSEVVVLLLCALCSEYRDGHEMAAMLRKHNPESQREQYTKIVDRVVRCSARLCGEIHYSNRNAVQLQRSTTMVHRRDLYTPNHQLRDGDTMLNGTDGHFEFSVIALRMCNQLVQLRFLQYPGAAYSALQSELANSSRIVESCIPGNFSVSDWLSGI